MAKSAIRRVTSYTASPVETCDRCGQGIKYVTAVRFADDTTRRYGMDCIEKVLAGDNRLLTLYRKNAKVLALRQRQFAVLSRPIDEIPHAFEYYGAGLFFVTDDDGEIINVERGSAMFHPAVDLERNAVSNYSFDREHSRTQAEFEARAIASIEKGRAFLAAEIERLSRFLARVLAGPIAKEAA